ncbi:hypothetical protein A2631_02205 [Candidatus Daviesbacteria bacterium RIFCSPHIGHO2_01_FULL_44_29]|uniref:Uncharacterized protein n=1 Tax=Candidatus Daviesbacteria bacterium RIFCSPHIGHO2_02_FULL_43_12 TaxID=1797776 RepID=A0A1F5KK88_9BACT|nr:MAG: hypothetical protein A2631_02205 [Candidatus Daviesbacteria bacterium RIFCSPHIGHO2_01_FULL_44_29]OGE41205.1 MAG: hypothetical protein A3D25_01600 [Candidatus Daviesbacteria bacterium RIFCSPHIGHO2_02_FULL_43_12]OGE69405.1 MAG: hypothetical protein A3B55_03340 [Candidatus Daviesbacteria bacterium RIFCSPLOWO2_01_FULL_43_15]
MDQQSELPPQQPKPEPPASMSAEDLIRQSGQETPKQVESFDEIKELMEEAPAALRSGNDTSTAHAGEGSQRSTKKEDRSTEYDYHVPGSEGFYADLMRDYRVPAERLRQLVEEEGVKPGDLQDILGARQILTIRESSTAEDEKQRLDSASLRVLVEGYHVVAGNITQFQRLVEAANKGINNTVDNKSYRFMPGQASTIFTATVDKFLDGQLRVGYAPLAPDVRGLKDSAKAVQQSKKINPTGQY